MSRLKFSVYGNCQNYPLSLILQSSPEFSRIYEEIPINSVHLLNPDEDEKVREIVSKLDLFIYQPVADGYRGETRKLGTKYLLSFLKNGARAISFTVAYFPVYNPEAVYFVDQNGTGILGVPGLPCDLHDLNILKAFHHGLTWQECVAYIQKGNIYTREMLTNCLSESLSRLREREKVIDVRILDFVEKNWRDQRLFFTINHCSNSILFHEANQILDLLKLPALAPASLTGLPEYLGRQRLFIHPDIRKHFALNFPAEAIQFDDLTYTLDDFVIAYFDFYRTHSDMIQHNIDYYAKSSDTTIARIASYWTMPSKRSQTVSEEIQMQNTEISLLHNSLRQKDIQIKNLQSELEIFKTSLKTMNYLNKVLPSTSKRRQIVKQISKAVVRSKSRINNILKKSPP
jgi:hypothetical protein